MRMSTVEWLVNRRSASQAADWAAVAVAASLPWSTSATSILIVAWIVTFTISVRSSELRNNLKYAAVTLPALIWSFAAIGMLWAEIPLLQRFSGLGAFHKLLVLPLLFIQFQRSERGYHVLCAYFVSCIILLGVSFIGANWPHWAPQWYRNVPASIPVKDHIAQSGEFLLCGFASILLAFDALKMSRHLLATCYLALGGLFFSNIAYIATSRTVLLVAPVLVVATGPRIVGWRGTIALIGGTALFATFAWSSSPYLRQRVNSALSDLQLFQQGQWETSPGYRLTYWAKSIEVIRLAPIAGHGTGSISAMLDRSVVAKGTRKAVIASNPHNQTLAVGIQLGLVGVGLLWAMWGCHLLLFRGSGTTACLGSILVLQNIVSSIFNSHITDFAQGWTYVFGVGVLGGMIIKAKSGACYRLPPFVSLPNHKQAGSGARPSGV